MMMGKEETSLEPYIEKYTESRIDSFIQSIKKDIAPSRMQYLCKKVLDLLKVTTTNSRVLHE